LINATSQNFEEIVFASADARLTREAWLFNARAMVGFAVGAYFGGRRNSGIGGKRK
jgi:hypothetical protein